MPFFRCDNSQIHRFAKRPKIFVRQNFPHKKTSKTFVTYIRQKMFFSVKVTLHNPLPDTKCRAVAQRCSNKQLFLKYSQNISEYLFCKALVNSCFRKTFHREAYMLRLKAVKHFRKKFHLRYLTGF